MVRTTFTSLKAGTHQIAFHNDHLPKVSVYLANALVPSDKGIALDQPVRDESQRKYTLKFRVTAPAPLP